jgi:phenylalanyl-tRNA synthetase alpha chain
MYRLTKEGEEYLKYGLPEKQLLKLLMKEKKSLNEISISRKEIAIGWAKKNGWIRIVDGLAEITDSGKEATKRKSEVERALEEVKKSGTTKPELIKILLRRRLIEEYKPVVEKKSIFRRLIEFFIRKRGKKIKLKEIDQLTPELIKTGEWKNIPFKRYDVNAPAPRIYPGKKQPYIQFIEDLKEKLIGLGFQEMKGHLIETSFLNCDALFIPQDHPAKSLHDIFYLKNPSRGKLPDENLVAKVKATHEGGWVTDSSGWGGSWKKEEAEKLVLRSHTTAVSARMLYENGDKPAKFFTIDRNFRPDVIDAKHLIEFYQCEGIVIGENLTFRHLLGFLKEIANAIGIKEIKFKPGYFPYTEPSVEGFVKHPTLGWIECLPAGMIRPEVLKPLGLEKSQVLAWGIGIDRLAMVKLGVNDIRMLFTNDLDWLRNTFLMK